MKLRRTPYFKTGHFRRKFVKISEIEAHSLFENWQVSTKIGENWRKSVKLRRTPYLKTGSPRLRNQLPSRALRIQKISHKLDSENVTATRVNFSRKHFTLSTKETVNDIDQRSQLLVLAFEKVTLPTVETKRNPQKREHENLKMEKGKKAVAGWRRPAKT